MKPSGLRAAATPTSIISPDVQPILARIRDRLLEETPERLFEAALAAQIGVAKSFDKSGFRTEVVGAADKWADGQAIVEALRAGAPEILEVSPWILEVVDREQALQEAIAICLTPRPAVRRKSPRLDYFDRLLRDRASHVVNRNAARAAVDDLLAVAARGELVVEIKNEQIDVHPDLQTGASILGALQKTQWFLAPPPGKDAWPRDQGLARYLLKRLTALGYAAAVPVLEELFRTTTDRIRWETAGALEALGSKLPREALIAAAEDGLLASDPEWEPRCGQAVWAVFEADPRTAYDKLGPYLDDPQLSDGGPPTVADKITAVLAYDHWGKRGPAGFGLRKRGFYRADPRWAALIERMAAHDPLWERFGWTFEKLSEAELLRRRMAWERRRRRQAPKVNGNAEPAKKPALKPTKKAAKKPTKKAAKKAAEKKARR